MENKRTLIAILLMLIVWMGFTVLFPPEKPTGGPADQQTEETRAPVAEQTPASSIEGTADAVPAPRFTADRQAEARRITVRSGIYEYILSSQGGVIKQVALTEYQKDKEKVTGAVTLSDFSGRPGGSLFTRGSDGFGVEEDALYQVNLERDEVRLAPGEEVEIVFSTRLDNGLDIAKVYRFSAESYDVDFSVEVLNRSGGTLSGNIAVGVAEIWDESMAGSYNEFVGPSIYSGGELNNVDVDDLAEGSKEFQNNIAWTGFQKKYFLSAFVPLVGSSERARIEGSGDLVINSVITPYRSLNPGESARFDFLGYFGPKDFDILKSVDHQLSEAIDFGFFGFLSRPLLHVLKFFYSFIGNYGVAIILLTVIIKAFFWPLTQKSYSSMKNMQKLQPEMQKLREKHKNDKQRLNVEMMNLYKEHRVNPLGGCLPMLIQIPVFFALYKVLLFSIELRQAEFFLWITDLSAKDPYYVTPLLMGATMFLQQKMTPTQMDPTQAKIFLAMPIVFTFLFLNFPSGLVIYWLVNNVLTIGQQALINRKKD